MKRKMLLGFGAALLIVTTSCGPKRYGCSRKRCIVENPKEKAIPANTTTTRNA